MDLNARPYRCFLAVVDKGTFHGAADLMHMSQPGLSAQIKELERQLGFELFDRSNRRVSLTAQGRLLRDYARRMVVETDWMAQAIREIRVNPLRLAAVHHSGDIPERRMMVEEFLRTGPDTPMVVASRTTRQVISDLSERLTDLGLILEPKNGSETDGPDEEKSSHLEKMIIGRRSVFLAAPPDLSLPLTGPLRLEGKKVVSVSRVHGVAVAEAVGRAIVAAGGQRVHAPEGDALSIRRYSSFLNLPCVDLGWFTPPNDPRLPRMIDHPHLTLEVELDLVLLRTRQSPHPVAQRFWDFAGAFFNAF